MMNVSLTLSLCFLVLAGITPATAITGRGTWYGGAGVGGACTSNFNYPGFRTVAMNKPQYLNGQACGGCVSGCFTQGGKQTCFKAIVDNLCPECGYGALDFGWTGDGIVNVNWKCVTDPRCMFL